MTECPHGTYYPVEPCNPCALDDGRIKPLPKTKDRVLGRGFYARYVSKCPGCGDQIEPGDPARKLDNVTHHAECARVEVGA